MTCERYDVSVNGQSTDAVGLRRLGALAFTHRLLQASPAAVQTIVINEQVTGEVRASWSRRAAGWSTQSVAGWMT
ncbi:MAG: hypothetical protein JWN04_5012 [Myxococcaceae bacterium]|nr:hypothetical protein [Myxococcaceae bacterium]